jgi:hypothetical protein
MSTPNTRVLTAVPVLTALAFGNLLDQLAICHAHRDGNSGSLCRHGQLNL